MAAQQATVPLLLGHVGQDVVDRNFAAIVKAFAEGCPIIAGAITDPVQLINGLNLITVPSRIKNPKGRLTIYQSVGGDQIDSGVDANGKWQLTSTVAGTFRFLFF